MGQWLYKDQVFTEEQSKGWFGFIYRITDLDTDEFYVGRKQFQFRRKLSKKATRRTTIESDWQDYYGSSVTLSKRIEEKGLDRFQREILVLCKSKGELNYSEVMALFHVKALEDTNCINESINKWRKSNISKYRCLQELRDCFVKKETQ